MESIPAGLLKPLSTASPKYSPLVEASAISAFAPERSTFPVGVKTDPSCIYIPEVLSFFILLTNPLNGVCAKVEPATPVLCSNLLPVSSSKGICALGSLTDSTPKGTAPPVASPVGLFLFSTFARAPLIKVDSSSKSFFNFGLFLKFGAIAFL